MIITNCDSTGDSDKHWPFLLEVATRIPTHPRPQCFNFLSYMCKIRHAIRKQLVRQICVSFAGIKLAKTTFEQLFSSFCFQARARIIL